MIRSVPRSRDAGVTLVEMLVVLSILGVMAAVVGLNLPGPRGGAALAAEADLLAARLGIAAEASVVTGRAAALDWDAGAYRFVAAGPDGWEPHFRAELAGDHALGGGQSLRRDGMEGSGRIELAPDASPPAGGVAEIALVAGAARETVRFDGLAAWREGAR